MNLRYAVSAVFSISIALAGCKDKPAPLGATLAPDTPPPKPSAIAVVEPAPSASASTPEPAPAFVGGPRFIVQRRTTKDAAFGWLGTAVVVCSNSLCRGDAYLITEKGLTDTYDPQGAITREYGGDVFKLDGPVWGFDYGGDYPEVCVSVIYFGDRSNSMGVTVKRYGKTWGPGKCGLAAPAPPSDDEDPNPNPRPPRDLDDALLHAPIAGASKTILHGASSPPMLIAEQALYLWDGKAWSKREAPSIKVHQKVSDRIPVSTEPVRLTSGATLVLEGGYLVDAKGEISKLNLVEEGKRIPSNAEVVGANWNSKFPWVIAMDDADIFVSTPDATEKASYVRFPVPVRIRAEKKPAAPTTTPPPSTSASAASSAAASPEPNPSASAASSASAPPTTAAPSSGLTESKPFTADCTTPFVQLASPPKPGQAYATTREGLRGHGELQDIVTFVEIVVEGKTYFGVQTRTEADARQFMEVVEKSVKGMKPQLRCLDVVSHVPDRYAPPEGIRIVGINLATGELVPFD